ncbi:hypothetical protein KTT_44310 [Tengunoibacter tsumagoiensis]|uniref:Uncharacterized protein n=1 Tax=Tengunoibacter tsumagoiensis TaxID=2014871 RepID=A0A402A619_9CHLR|nr:hypothetical protein KTT_44310 [Tengunoibacter tsumagoiensis]
MYLDKRIISMQKICIGVNNNKTDPKIPPVLAQKTVFERLCLWYTYKERNNKKRRAESPKQGPVSAKRSK